MITNTELAKDLATIERAATRLRAALLRVDAIGDGASREAAERARKDYEALLRGDAQTTAPGAQRPARGEPMGATTTGLEAHVALRLPNVPTSMAHVLTRNGVPLVSVTVKNAAQQKDARVSVRAWIEGFSATAVMSCEIARKEEATFNLFPPLFPDRVRSLTEMTIGSLHVEVRDLDGKDETLVSYPVPLLAPTTAVLAQVDPSTKTELDLTPFLSAWVTPNAPEVLTFLRTCADFSKLNAMLGYQIEAAGIREHARAIYEALKAAGIVYVNSPTAFGAATSQFIQRVRLPRESLAQRSANCIDGTVLMASLLEATALDSAIVLVPGHAFLGYRTAPDAQNWEYVETTMIGTDSFEKACEAALATTKKYAELGQRKIIDVFQQRQLGITPME